MKNIERMITFEGQPGSRIYDAADEAVAEFQRMISAGEVKGAWPRAALIFNERVLRIYENTTADEVRAAYYKAFQR